MSPHEIIQQKLSLSKANNDADNIVRTDYWKVPEQHLEYEPFEAHQSEIPPNVSFRDDISEVTLQNLSKIVPGM